MDTNQVVTDVEDVAGLAATVTGNPIITKALYLLESLMHIAHGLTFEKGIVYHLPTDQADAVLKTQFNGTPYFGEAGEEQASWPFVSREIHPALVDSALAPLTPVVQQVAQKAAEVAEAAAVIQKVATDVGAGKVASVASVAVKDAAVVQSAATAEQTLAASTGTAQSTAQPAAADTQDDDGTNLNE